MAYIRINPRYTQCTLFYVTRHRNTFRGSAPALGLLLWVALCQADIALAAARAAQAVTPSQPDTLAELIATAEQQGSVRVLVSLNTGLSTRSPSQLPILGRHLQRLRVVEASLSVEQARPEWSDQVIRRYRHLPMLALNATADDLLALSELPQVLDIHRDRPLQRTLSQSGAVIGVPQLRQQGLDGSGQVIVVMDDGIDRNHPFFNNPEGDSRIIDGACFSAEQKSGIPSDITTLCPNGTATQFGPEAADINLVSACDDNECYHGTHVAGIAAGWSANREGVASNANLIPIQVFTRFSDGLSSSTIDLLAALEHVETLLGSSPAPRIAAINMSLGDDRDEKSDCDDVNPAMTDAIERLRNAGVATVISSGNAGQTNGMSFPACISHAVAVASTQNNDVVSSFSNVSGLTALFAPGTSIVSAFPNNRLAQLSGTSMAAPQVSGAWAALKPLSPDLSVDQLLNHLQTTGVPIEDIEHTLPRIQLDQAAAAIPTRWLGTIDNDWHKPDNWSQARLPDCTTSALIPADADHPPQISSAAAVRNLIIEANATVSTITGASLNLCGDLTLMGDGDNRGQLDLSQATLVVDSQSDRVVALPAELSVISALSMGGGNQSQTLVLSGNVLVDGDLIIGANGTLQLAGHRLAVAGELTLAGALEDEQTLAAGETRQFMSLPKSLANDETEFALRGLGLTAADSDLGVVSTEIRVGQACDANATSNLTQRCFDITPTQPAPSTVTLWLSEAERNEIDASQAMVLRFNGTRWAGASSTNQYQRSASSIACNDNDHANQCRVTAEAVTDYSPFALGAFFYSVGGEVSGLAEGNRVDVRLLEDGDNQVPIENNGPFTLPQSLLDESSYTIQSALTRATDAPRQICALSNVEGVIAGADVEDVLIQCTTLQFSLGGSVNGLAGSGLALALSLDGTAADVVDISDNGAFTLGSFDDLSDYVVTVTSQPTQPSQTCAISAGNGRLDGADADQVAVVCETNRYALSGQVSGLAEGNRIDVSIAEDANNELVGLENGPFTLPQTLLDESSYTVQSNLSRDESAPRQTCALSNGEGVLAGAAVTDISIVCQTLTFAVGGSVTGLTSGRLQLTLNDADPISITDDGPFVFGNELPDLSNYRVELQHLEASPLERCELSNAEGSIDGAEINSVQIVCTQRPDPIFSDQFKTSS